MASLYDVIIDKNGVERHRKDKKYTNKENIPDAVMEVLTTENVVDENGLIVVDKKTESARTISDEEQAKIDKAEATSEEEPQEESDDDGTTDEEVLAKAEEPQEDEDEDDEEMREAERQLSNADDTTNSKGQANTPRTPEVSLDEEDDDQEVAKPAPAKKAEKRTVTPPKFVSKVPQSKPGMGFPKRNGKTVDIFDLKTPHTHLKLIGGHTVPLSAKSFDSRTEREIEDRLLELGFTLVDYNRAGSNADSALLDDSDDDGLVDDRP